MNTPTLPTVFLQVLELSLHGGLALTVVAVLRLLIGKKIAPRYRSFLWLPALLAFVAPVSLLPQNPVALPAQPVIQESVSSVRIQWMARPPEPEPRSLIQQGSSGEQFSFDAPVAKPKRPFPWLASLAVLWSVGAVLMLGAAWMASTKFRRAVLLSRKEPEPRTLAAWRQLANGKKLPQLVCSYAVNTPVLAGFLRPMVVLPAEREKEYSNNVLSHIFRHELAHYHRGDLYFLLLERVVLIAHWFNPLLWFSHKLIRVDREIGADAAALDTMDQSEALSYGQALLDVAAGRTTVERMPIAVGIFESKKQLAARLRGIASHRRAGRFAAAGVTLLIAFLTLSVFGRAREADLAPYQGMPEEQALVQAAKDGDLPAVRHYLKSGPNLNTTVDWYGPKSAISAAASRNHIAVLELLLEVGADPNFKPEKGRTAWEAAIRSGRKEAAELLLKKGAIVDERLLAAYRGDAKYFEPILKGELTSLPFETIALWNEIAAVNNHVALFRLTVIEGRKHDKIPSWNFPPEGGIVTAIARGNKEVIEEFIELCPDELSRYQDGPVRIGEAAEQTPGMKEWLIARKFTVPAYAKQEELIDASGRGDLFKMKQLLDAGIDPNYSGESGWSPVVKAANSNKIDAVKLLLERGGNPNSVKSPGWNYSALTLCENPKIADVLLAAGADVNGKLFKRDVHIVSYQITFGHTEMVKWFVSKGVDLAKEKTDEPTFLFDAGNAEIAKILIEKGIDPKVTDKEGRTALHNLAQMKEKGADILKVLLEAGADPNAKDKFGMTPLMLARDGEAVEILLKYGADPNLKTVEGQGLLELTSHMANVSRLKVLLQHGLTMDQNGKDQLLQTAAWSGQEDIVEYLLDQGADPNAKISIKGHPESFWEPLVSASVYGRVEILKILLNRGGKPETGMATALFNHQSKAVKLFWERGARNIPESVYLISQNAPLEQLKPVLSKEGKLQFSRPGTEGMLSHPFTAACAESRMDVIEYLLPQYKSEKTLLDEGISCAAHNGGWEVIELLLKNGAPADIGTLSVVASNSNPYVREPRKQEDYARCGKLLIEAGVLKNATGSQRANLMQSAIFTRQPGGNEEFIKQLLAAGLSGKEEVSPGKTVLALMEESCEKGYCSAPSDELLTLLGGTPKKKTE